MLVLAMEKCISWRLNEDKLRFRRLSLAEIRGTTMKLWGKSWGLGEQLKDIRGHLYKVRGTLGGIRDDFEIVWTLGGHPGKCM